MSENKSNTPKDEQQLIAVKELFSQEEREFLKEATILRALGPRNHAHLIKLLATFEKNQTYHLLFPYADANLRKYWDEHPTPDFNKETVLWSTEQMTGIASGLVQIHTFKVTHPLFIPGSGDVNYRNPGNFELKVEGGEQWFGRHGDIKPENILWFAGRRNYPHSKGVLQIADFGLGRFHGRDSRSGVNPDGVVSSPTYEPPECKLRLPVSRAYDIWSLGCLYLEFITWLLKGNAQIEGFSNARGRVPTGGIVDEDSFFTITTPYDTKDAEVKKGVLTWVAQLHAHEKCSQMIHDILDLIMSELLVIDSKHRTKAVWVYNQLRLYLEKARRDDEYLLTPVPIPIPKEEDDFIKLTELKLANGKPKANSVTFSEQEIPSRPGNNTHPKSRSSIDRVMGKKDLLGRMKGPPRIIGIAPHRTWPDRQQTMH
jgi:serine/threonine protein kinase